MLKVPTPFPQVGSFALMIDESQPFPQSAELVRIQRRYRMDAQAPVAVSFPLRTGASGYTNTTVDRLIDATPLARDEERALTDALNHLRGRDKLTPRLKALQARAAALKQRQIYATVLEGELRKLRALEGREVRRGGGSTGGQMPGELAA